MISYYVRETLGYIPLLMVWIALFAIMDDKRHPYYEHRLAA